MTTKTEYDVQAEAWAAKYGVRMEAKFMGHRKYFPGDTDTRDTYRITLTKGDRSMSFDYGTSLVDSQVADTSDGPYWSKRERDIEKGVYGSYAFGHKVPNRKRIAPSTTEWRR